MLAQRTGKGRGGRTSGRGKLMQVVQLGPRSRRRGYPVTVAQHTLGNAYVRRFKFGGIAKRKHLSKRGGSMAANRRRRSRRTSRRVSRNAYVLAMNGRRRRSRRRRSLKSNRRRSRRSMRSNRRRSRRGMRRNRRRSRRRSSMKLNRNRRRRRRSIRRNGRRRLRRNSVLGLSLPDVTGVIKPTIAGAAGFVGARLAGNAAQRIPFVANLGPWGGVLTDLALGFATLTVGEKLPVIGATIRQNQTAIVVGMGLDAVHRILGIVHVPILSETMAVALPGRVATPAAPTSTSGFGAYIDVSHAGAPYKGMLGTGEYVETPMGEYVEQPMGDAGIFTANLFDGMTGG